MTALSFTDFRKNMASSFDRVDAGEFVFINRGNKKKARKEYQEGKTLKFESAKDAQKWMEEL